MSGCKLMGIVMSEDSSVNITDIDGAGFRRGADHSDFILQKFRPFSPRSNHTQDKRFHGTRLTAHANLRGFVIASTESYAHSFYLSSSAGYDSEYHLVFGYTRLYRFINQQTTPMERPGQLEG